MLLMAYVGEIGLKGEDIWFLDSGCSNHMCSDKTMFTELDAGFQTTVKLGNNTRMQVCGKGSVKMEVDGFSCTVTDVYCVPELKNNLLSMGQLQEKGLDILIGSGKCKIHHPTKGLIIQTEMTANRMFVLFAKRFSGAHQARQDICFNTSSNAKIQDPAYLWHCRLGHISNTNLQVLQNNNLVTGLPELNISTELCVDCLKGKQHREPIPKKSTWRATERLELIHADLCGPISPASNTGKKYVFCLTDDYSRKVWAYILSDKSEAFDFFKIFKIFVEKETSLSIKGLRTDRGGEFTSNEFNSFCRENGIKRQLTTAYTPQQNGVAERKNRTIMNSVRSMMFEKKVPKSFWPEGIQWAVYVLNRCPTVALKNKTPEEAWSGKKPSVAHFKIFGCVCHRHIPDAMRTKLESKSASGVFLGIGDETKGYRIYDPIANKIVLSRDVVFEEGKNWDWEKKHESEILVDLEWAGSDEEMDVESEHEKENAADKEIVTGTRDAEKISTTEESVAVVARSRRPPERLNDFVSGEGLSDEEDATMNFVHAAFFANTDPVSFEEAINHDEWRKAMKSEINSIEKNRTWVLTNLP